MATCSINLQLLPRTSKTVDDELFGANVLFTADSVSTDATLPVVLDQCGVSSLRYPGGTIAERYFDLAHPDATVATDVITGSTRGISLTLTSFLGFAAENGHAAQIVIPTYRYFDTATRTLVAGAEQEIGKFIVDLLHGAYGDCSIAAFEIGNEHYSDLFNWSAAEFGEIQSQIALVVSEAIASSNAESQPSVLIQSGRGDSDGNGIDDNIEFLDQMDAPEMAAIDGITSHVYAVSASGNPFVAGLSVAEKLVEDRDFWNAAADRDLTQVVSEWNTGDAGPAATGVTGLMRLAPLLRIFASMCGVGVDAAQIWAAQNSIPTSLSGKEGDVGGLALTGKLFALMAENLPGTSLRGSTSGTTLEDEDGAISGVSYVFSGGGKTVIYLVSTSDEEFRIHADLTDLVTQRSAVQFAALTCTEGSAPSDYRAEADLVYLSKEDLLSGQSINKVSYNLAPYELLQITIISAKHDDGFTSVGDRDSSVADAMNGSRRGDQLQGELGDDSLVGGGGADVLDGGAGNDELLGGRANDILFGSSGLDTLTGGSGADCFVFEEIHLSDLDVVNDFQIGVDRIYVDLDALDLTFATAVDGDFLGSAAGAPLGAGVLVEGVVQDPNTGILALHLVSDTGTSIMDLGVFLANGIPLSDFAFF